MKMVRVNEATDIMLLRLVAATKKLNPHTTANKQSVVAGLIAKADKRRAAKEKEQ
jgi:hypothetical protein